MVVITLMSISIPELMPNHPKISQKFNNILANGSAAFNWYVNIGSGTGLVPNGTKPSPETMLTQTYDTKWLQ